MDFYLLSADTTFYFPVNPQEVTVAGEKQLHTISLLNIGEVDFPTGDKRTEIRFSAFFPRDYDPGYCQTADLPDPQEAISQLIAWRTAGLPLRLMITESPVNDLVLIARLEYSIRGGEVGDIYFDIGFRQWREVKVRTKATDQKKQSAPPKERPDTKPKPKTYTVKAGDSLWKIAKATMGNGSRWKDLYNANKAVIGPDPDKLKPGTKLVIP